MKTEKNVRDCASTEIIRLYFIFSLFFQAISHNLHLTKVQKEQIEQELITQNREKSDILEQLQHVTRQRNALAEDLLAAKKDIERLSDSNLRLTKEKEELNKDRNNLAVDVTASERENRKHTEVTVEGTESFSGSNLILWRF